jgi:catechol 2,3-dioxygenase
MISRLSHTELGVTDLDEAHHFYVEILGFRLAERTDESLYLRGAEEFDSWSLKLTRGTSGGLHYFGFRTSSDQALDDLVELHERIGAPVRDLPPGSEIGWGRAIEVLTPDGYTIRFVRDIEEIELPKGVDQRLPMRYTHLREGIPPARIHHLNVRGPDMAAAMEYWRGELGFSMAECTLDQGGDLRIAWLRRSHHTHDVAIGKFPEVSFHHLAFAVADAATVLRTADVLADGGFSTAIEFGPGRHGGTNSMMTYAFDPFGNRLEFFTGDYVRDHDREPIVWDYESYERVGRIWWGAAPPESFLQRVGPILGTESTPVR